MTYWVRCRVEFIEVNIPGQNYVVGVVGQGLEPQIALQSTFRGEIKSGRRGGEVKQHFACDIKYHCTLVGNQKFKITARYLFLGPLEFITHLILQYHAIFKVYFLIAKIILLDPISNGLLVT